MRRTLLFTLAVALTAGPAVAEEVVVIRGGRVIPVSAPPIDDGVVILKDGKIEAVGGSDTEWTGTGVDVKTVDATGRIVMPGLVDALTSVGLIEIGMVQASRDDDEATAPMTPLVHTADGINVASSMFRITRMNGTTTVLVAPAEGNLVNGRSCLIALDGDRLDAMLRRPHAAMHVSLGDPPALRYGGRKQTPSTRMGEMAMLRSALVKAGEYRAKWKTYEEKLASKPEDDKPDPPDRDLALEAWLPILDRTAPLLVRAQRLSDIQAALRIAKEFDVRVVIVRGTDAWKMAGELAKAKVPVLLGPVTQQPSSVETLGAIYESAAELHEAGVEFAIVSASTHNARNLPYEAGIAVAYGLPEDVALEAITLRPARILDVADRVGSLAKGLDADVIVLDGPVIQPRTKVLRMWIRGREVELTSRQTELADEHR